jgi:hypothetical protein
MSLEGFGLEHLHILENTRWYFCVAMAIKYDQRIIDRWKRDWNSASKPWSSLGGQLISARPWDYCSIIPSLPDLLESIFYKTKLHRYHTTLGPRILRGIQGYVLDVGPRWWICIGAYRCGPRHQDTWHWTYSMSVSSSKPELHRVNDRYIHRCCQVWWAALRLVTLAMCDMVSFLCSTANHLTFLLNFDLLYISILVWYPSVSRFSILLYDKLFWSTKLLKRRAIGSVTLLYLTLEREHVPLDLEQPHGELDYASFKPG